MEFNPVNWFEIYVNDLERAGKFYSAVMNCTLLPMDPPNDDGIKMLGFPSDHEKYGAAGALVKMDGVPVGNNSTLVYFYCEDCALEESRVEAAGGKILKSKFAIGEHGFIAHAIDSEGNMIGLHSMK